MTYSINSEKNHYKDMMWAILPLIFCGMVLYGPRVALLSAIAWLTARAVDVMVSMVRHQEFDSTDHSSTLSAVVFCLLLPVNIPIYVVIISVGITILVGKHLFGGKDVYPFNLSALCMCVAAVNWPEKVFEAVVPFSKVNFWTGLTSNVTLSNAGIIKEGGVPAVSTFNMLLGNHPGVMGGEFILVVLAVGVFLLVSKRITWHIPVAFLATCTLIAFVFPRIYGFSRLDSVKMELLNGAVIYCAVFMINEPATTPYNPKAKLVFGVLTGALSMVFRYFGGYEIGVCFALLLVNTLEGFIERTLNATGKIKVLKPIYKGGEIFSPQVKNISQKLENSKAVLKKEKISGTADAMDLIGEAEDNIDQVLYSTRTLDIAEILAEEERRKKAQRKAGKSNNEQ